MMFLLKEFIKESLLKVFLQEENNVFMVKMTNSQHFLPTRVVFKSPKKNGMWQMQTFDKNMNPKWDCQYKTLFEATFSQIKIGFEIKDINTCPQASQEESKKILIYSLSGHKKIFLWLLKALN